MALSGERSVVRSQARHSAEVGVYVSVFNFAKWTRFICHAGRQQNRDVKCVCVRACVDLEAYLLTDPKILLAVMSLNGTLSPFLALLFVIRRCGESSFFSWRNLCKEGS